MQALTAKEATSLDERGYLVLENVLSPEQVALLNNRRDGIAQREGPHSVRPEPTRTQYWSCRTDHSLGDRILAGMYRSTSKLTREAAERWLFRFLPKVEWTVAGSHGSPAFQSDQVRRHH